MSPKSGYSVQIACTNLLSCLNGHFLTACYCSFQREDSSHPTSIVSVGYHVTRAILNKSWRQHPTRHQLYDHLPPITKTIQVRRTRHAGHCWRSRDELISDVLLWTPTYGRTKAGRPTRTYIQQLCEDTGCSPEDLPEAMNDRWRERVRDIHASGTTWWWWWWWWWVYIHIYKQIHIQVVLNIPQSYGIENGEK